MSKADKIDEIFKESKTLKMLDHKYIIKLHHYFVLDGDKIVMIMEYANGGELRDYVET